MAGSAEGEIRVAVLPVSRDSQDALPLTGKYDRNDVAQAAPIKRRVKTAAEKEAEKQAKQRVVVWFTIAFAIVPAVVFAVASSLNNEPFLAIATSPDAEMLPFSVGTAAFAAVGASRTTTTTHRIQLSAIMLMFLSLISYDSLLRHADSLLQHAAHKTEITPLNWTHGTVLIVTLGWAIVLLVSYYKAATSKYV